MAQSISLHIGLENVQEAHYGYLNPLLGAPQDALFMQQLAIKNKFNATTLLNEQATRQAVCTAFIQASQTLVTGDTFLISYSGHGGQFPCAKYGIASEADGKDDTWCLYDEQMIDDELYALYTKFKPGVNIIVVSDSCHSGTITRGDGINKTILKNLQNRILKNHLSIYKQRKKEAQTKAPLQANVLLLAACLENEEAIDSGFNGVFTMALKIAMQQKPKNYNELMELIKEKTLAAKYEQTATLNFMGNSDFSKDKIPFTF
jgi:metacaspase-1